MQILHFLVNFTSFKHDVLADGFSIKVYYLTRILSLLYVKEKDCLLVNKRIFYVLRSEQEFLNNLWG